LKIKIKRYSLKYCQILGKSLYLFLKSLIYKNKKILIANNGNKILKKDKSKALKKNEKTFIESNCSKGEFINQFY
jgi:hypothetical protein